MKSPQPDAFMVLNILDAVGLSGIDFGKKKLGATSNFINWFSNFQNQPYEGSRKQIHESSYRSVVLQAKISMKNLNFWSKPLIFYF